MKRIVYLLLLSISFWELSAQNPLFLKDHTISSHSNPLIFGNKLGDITFLTATSVQHGSELWKADAITGQISFVKDILPGKSGGVFADNDLIGDKSGAVVNGKFVFNAQDSLGGSELWITDGTEAGTMMLKNINPSGPSHPSFFKASDSYVYFNATIGPTAKRIWRTDGTVSGTIPLADIKYGSGTRLSFITGDTIFYTGYNDSTGYELWLSDGTVAGTSIVKDINVGTGGSNLRFFEAKIGNQFFFSANDGVYGQELWTTDGTEQGTFRLTDINTTGNSISIMNCEVLNGNFIFSATDSLNKKGVWKTDGTISGTVKLSDLYNNNNFLSFKYNNKLYFSNNDGVNGSELWVTDGTVAGTQMVKDINPGTGSSNITVSKFTPVINNKFYFGADDGINGAELWESDGTAAGTVLFMDINPGAASSTPRTYISNDNKMIFTATTADKGIEYWGSDGTVAGTEIIREFVPGVGDNVSIVDSTSVQFNTIFFPFGNDFLFTMEDNQATGRELWITDGTAAGTQLKYDFFQGGTNATRFDYFKSGNTYLWYTAKNFYEGLELWRTDGTSANTQLTKDITANCSMLSYLYANNSSVFAENYMVEFNGKFYFRMQRCDGLMIPSETWVSDGTEAGTTFFSDDFLQPFVFNNELYNNYPFQKYDFSADSAVTIFNAQATNLGAVDGSTMYLGMNDGVSGYELWKSDGTTSGTVLVKDINSGSASSMPGDLVSVGNTSFFTANDGINGKELWKSDGTTSGTVLVKDINSGSASSNLYSLVGFGNTLFFVAYDGTARALWKSDGTQSGTVKVRDMNVVYEMIVVGNRLFMEAKDSSGGDPQIWVSDGTAAGTTLFADINVNGKDLIDQVVYGNNRMYFVAYDGTNKGLYEITDTSTAPNLLLAFDTAVVDFADISDLTFHQGDLYFAAQHRTYDVELWKYETGITSVGLVRLDEAADFARLYPNPTNGQFNIELDAAMDLHVRIYNAAGALIQQGNYTQTQQLKLDIQQQPQGMYFVHLSDQNNTQVLKLIKE